MPWIFGSVLAVLAVLLWHNPHSLYWPCLHTSLCSDAAKHDLEYKMKRDNHLLDARIAHEKKKMDLELEERKRRMERDDRPAESTKKYMPAPADTSGSRKKWDGEKWVSSEAATPDKSTHVTVSSDNKLWDGEKWVDARAPIIHTGHGHGHIAHVHGPDCEHRSPFLRLRERRLHRVYVGTPGYPSYYPAKRPSCWPYRC
jgi:hypothetical protein